MMDLSNLSFFFLRAKLYKTEKEKKMDDFRKRALSRPEKM